MGKISLSIDLSDFTQWCHTSKLVRTSRPFPPLKTSQKSFFSVLIQQISKWLCAGKHWSKGAPSKEAWHRGYDALHSHSFLNPDFHSTPRRPANWELKQGWSSRFLILIMYIIYIFFLFPWWFITDIECSFWAIPSPWLSRRHLGLGKLGGKVFPKAKLSQLKVTFSMFSWMVKISE